MTDARTDRPQPSQPPVARRAPVSEQRHGVMLVDDYAWLRDENWREAMHDPSLLHADIAAYLQAENDHTDAHMAPLSVFRQRLVAELRARIAERDTSVPTPDGDWYYYVRFREAGQHPAHRVGRIRS